jgi:nicotinamide mononucleotide transporter
VTPLALAEAVAVVLAVAYLVLAIRQQPLCWLAGALSAALYWLVLWEARLLLEAWLQVFYVGMAAWGWWQWRHGRGGGPLRVQVGTPGQNLALLAAVALVAGAAGALLTRYPGAALPFADAGIAVASLVATALTARKWLDSWYWWFGIDAASVAVYLERGLYPTAGLFAVYLGLVVVGWRAWRRSRATAP